MKLTTVVATERFSIGGAVEAVRFDHVFLGDFPCPVILFDHVNMRTAGLPPRHHAGLCVFSYLLEDSPGSLRERDPVTPEVVVEPGDLLWRLMASDMVHEERPAVDGEVVHQVEVWVNLSVDKHSLPSATFLLKSADVPEVYSDEGSRIRVVLGECEGKRSPLTPTEPFSLLDIHLVDALRLQVPARWTAIFYVLAGETVIDDGEERRKVCAGEVVGVREEACLTLQSEQAQIVYMARSIYH